MTEPKCKPGDVVILTHGRGGRLFEVYQDTGTGLVEKASLPDQQKYCSPHGYWQFVRFPTVADAKAAVRLMDDIEIARRTLHKAADRAAKEEWAKLLAQGEGLGVEE